MRDHAHVACLHNVLRDGHGRKDKVLEVRTEFEEGEHEQPVDLAVQQVPGTERDPQLREVRPVGVERGQHARAEHEPVEGEPTQPRCRLDPRDICVSMNVTLKREMLEEGEVPKQQIWHSVTAKGDVEPYDPAGVGLQELRHLVLPPRVVGRLTRVDSERERTAPRAGKPVVIKD